MSRQDDATLARLFEIIGTTNRIAVDIGARDGVKGSNTYPFRQQGWTCVLLDAAPKGPLVRQAWLTRENIRPTLIAYEVPPSFDLLSIDVDGNDLWLWEGLSTGFRPRVVVIEYNSRFAPTESVVMAYNAAHRWDRTTYYGASAAALVKLGARLGYALVSVTPKQNLFFVRHDAADEATLAALGTVPVPQADPCGYPSDRGRRWEVYG